jgi:hypothetical protein
MADSLANLAVDTRTSSQVLHPTAHSGHVTLTAHLSNDLSPWLASMFCLSIPLKLLGTFIARNRLQLHLHHRVTAQKSAAHM